jgi:hypothetical protein
LELHARPGKEYIEMRVNAPSHHME